MAPVTATLQQYPPLSSLAPESIQSLANCAIRRTYTKGQHLWREGDAAASLSVIARGRVKLIKHAPGGRDVLVEVCGPGHAPGDVAVYDGGLHPASAVALEEVEVVQLPTSELISVLSGNAEAALSVLGDMAKHARALSRRVTDLGEGGVERRLALTMCRLCELVDAPEGPPVEIPVPLSRQDLADMVGTTLETTIRVMSRWAQGGIVKTKRDGFVVRDCTALQTLVGSSPRGGERTCGECVCVRKLPT